MTPKAILTLVIGILALGITAWKGPSVWAAVSMGITTLALLVGTLRIVPKEDEEYIQALEDALNKTTNTQDAAAAIIPGKSRLRYLRRVGQ